MPKMPNAQEASQTICARTSPRSALSSLFALPLEERRRRTQIILESHLAVSGCGQIETTSAPRHRLAAVTANQAVKAE